MELAAVVGEVRGFLDGEGIPFAVVGALALHTYGYSRATNDVDLLVGSEAQDQLIAFLEQRGFEPLALCLSRINVEVHTQYAVAWRLDARDAVERVGRECERGTGFERQYAFVV